MLCEDCHKREALVKFTQVMGSEKKTVNLCKNCAEKKGLNNPLVDISKVFGKIIVTILSEHLAAKTEQIETQGEDQKTCSVCGLTWAEFEKVGRLGCPDCYNTFTDRLNTLLRRLHGNNQHIGRSEVEPEVQNSATIESLQKKLQSAIENEEYESAAELRDRIRALQHNVGTSRI